ncbi:Ig-like domain-containing protein [Diaminobutyricimonas aerilata]|uniref:Ig-like domain-containing protein n=1 Tax=Diaminobutyricimonas aerilata TaxID=1162967 RepID=A0A2M9CIB2_9MICO|nr:Ig-like domain-containing protein [Diaminobutyricimonas aerilata]PJJ71666.1 Ig-like domain-containing protein [Diaminobutyricimonas aerilata]
MSGRSRSSWAAVAATALILTGVGIASPAHADAPQPTVDYPAGFGDSSFEHTYGADAPAARRIEIGTATRTVRLDPGFDVFLYMNCFLEAPNGGQLSGRTWHEEEWAITDNRRLPVPEGRVIPGELYEVWCDTGEFTSERTRWILSAVEGGPTTLPLFADASKAVVEHETVFLGGGQSEQRTLAAGDRVTITGSPGTWARQGEIDTATVVVVASAGSGRVETVPEISGDRSALTFVVPDEATTAALTGRIELQVRVDSTLAGSDTVPAQTYSAWWVAEAILVDQKTSSSVRLALSGEYAVSVRRVTGTARVIAPGTPHPLGTATVVVDGVAVQALQLRDGAGGRVTFTLPLLKRGTHDVSVVYSGTDTIRGSTSPTTSVRVIF